MKLSMMINYISDFQSSAKQVVELEKVGLDMVWVAEAYSYDSISQIGYLAAVTNKLEIGTGIINVYSRTPALVAMTAAGCDYVSNGRFVLGLGASGAQVIEGFHGMPYEKPLQRTKEYIEICREVWKREKPLSYSKIKICIHSLKAPKRGSEQAWGQFYKDLKLGASHFALYSVLLRLKKNLSNVWRRA